MPATAWPLGSQPWPGDRRLPGAPAGPIGPPSFAPAQSRRNRYRRMGLSCQIQRVGRGPLGGSAAWGACLGIGGSSEFYGHRWISPLQALTFLSVGAFCCEADFPAWYFIVPGLICINKRRYKIFSLIFSIISSPPTPLSIDLGRYLRFLGVQNLF